MSSSILGTSTITCLWLFPGLMVDFTGLDTLSVMGFFARLFPLLKLNWSSWGIVLGMLVKSNMVVRWHALACCCSASQVVSKFVFRMIWTDSFWNIEVWLIGCRVYCRVPCHWSWIKLRHYLYSWVAHWCWRQYREGETQVLDSISMVLRRALIWCSGSRPSCCRHFTNWSWLFLFGEGGRQLRGRPSFLFKIKGKRLVSVVKASLSLHTSLWNQFKLPRWSVSVQYSFEMI